MNRLQERVQEFSRNRIFMLLCSVIILFMILVFRLFLLQIIHGEEYEQKLTTSILRQVSLPASRGAIYDRYGRPLAVNHVAYSIQIDDSITLDLSNYKARLVTDFAAYMKQKNTPLVDALPISKSKPYSFQFETLKEEQDWKKENIPKNMMNATAEEVIAYFENELNIPSSFSEEEKRSIISFYISVNDRNLMVLSLLKILEENNESLADDLPITEQQPYTFLFDDNKGKELSWKGTVSMTTEEEQAYDATQTIDYLQDYFAIPKELPADIVRKAIGIRYAMYLQRFYRYQPVTISLDVSTKTLANVEEMNDIFPCIIVGTNSLRDYPMGKYFSHIIGYTRKMTDSNYAVYKDDVDEEGNKIYTMNDVVGQSGIESIYERELNGKDGEMVVEVDSMGRRMNTIESKNPVSGKDVFLTLDSRLQKSAYDILENTLRDIIKRKLNGGDTTLQELFSRMIADNSISIDKICNSTEGEQYILYQKILEQDAEFSLEITNTQTEGEQVKPNPRDFAQQVLTSAIDRGEITPRQLILVLIEQGKFSADAQYLAGIQSGAISPLQVINDKLDSGELTPGDTNLDPCTGSVVISRVDSGELLASVTYPSYDTNELSNNFNNAYYNELLHRESTTPLVNRPMSERKAPGSTFKMIPALAALETGIITPNSTITDLGSFTKASKPYPKCWIFGSSGRTHGAINVAHALEVSCNYFFYELAYRMGNASEKTTAQGIATLNEYMAAFGLNDYTGIEIGESSPMMATPTAKERSIRTINPNATESQVQWSDGDSIRAFIGQSVNNYAPIHMTKYIATLANGGTRYKMHMVSKLMNADGSVAKQVEEEVENILELQQQNLDIVYQGMLLVTSGQKGTLRAVFKDFPIQVAAKSGTAEEDKSRSSHSWFVCFAPYDDPQIAVTVLLPYGEISGAPAAVIAREIIKDYMGLNYEPENHYMENILTE